MIQLIINHDKSFVIKINPFESIYSLKDKIHRITNIPIDSQILTYEEHILSDDSSFYEYKIKNNSIIHLSQKLEGGAIDMLTILIGLLYVVIFLLYVFIMLSGLIPFLSKVVAYVINKVINFFKIKNPIFNFLLNFISFMVQHFSLLLFVYTITAVLIYPLVYTVLGYSNCHSISKASTAGWIVAWTYVIFYILLNLNNVMFDLLEDVMAESYFVSIFKPFLENLRKTISMLTYYAFYLIPFVGGYIKIFHDGIDGLLAKLNKMNPKNIEEFKRDMEEWNKSNKRVPFRGKFGKVEINRRNENYYDTYAAYLQTNEFKKLECIYENKPFWKKYFFFLFDSDIGKYYGALIFGNLFNKYANLSGGLSTIIERQGGIERISDEVKTGNIAGIIGLVAFIVSVVLVLLDII